MLNVPPEWTKVARRQRALFVVSALLLATAAMRRFVVLGFLVEGESMKPTLNDGDYLLVNRAATGTPVPVTGWRLPGYATIRHGDILVMRAGRGPDRVPLIAKRVMGLPGDVVSMDAGNLVLNDQAVEEPFVASPLHQNEATVTMEWQAAYLADKANTLTYFPTRGNWGPLRVPPGMLLVLGDNRDHSVDSRELGFIPVREVLGRVDLVLWSRSRSCCGVSQLVRSLLPVPPFRPALAGVR